MLMRIANDEAYARQRRDFCGGTLRIASGDYDSRLRILAAHAADGSPRILVGGGCDRAGVQHDHRGLRRCVGTGKTALLELTFESCAVGLGGAAAEVFYVIARHVSMLAQRAVARRGANCLIAKLPARCRKGRWCQDQERRT